MSATSPDPSKFVATMRVSRLYDSNHWEHIKRELIHEFLCELFPQMIDDGRYHVMKFDYYKAENQHLDMVEYSLICRHSIAQSQTVIYYEADPIQAYIKSAGLKPVCSYCGDTLKLDKRGGCSGCGGPAGGEGLQS